MLGNTKVGAGQHRGLRVGVTLQVHVRLRMQMWVEARSQVTVQEWSAGTRVGMGMECRNRGRGAGRDEGVLARVYRYGVQEQGYVCG